MKFNNTYKQDNNFKDLAFSNENDLTELDLDIIENRTTTYEVFDYEYEKGYWGNEYEEYTSVPEYNSYEMQYDSGSTFQIGNNMKGGI